MTQAPAGTVTARATLTGTVSIPRGKDTVLRPATTSTLGGIIVGDNLDVTETGTLSALTDEDDFPELTNLEIEQIISNLGGF